MKSGKHMVVGIFYNTLKKNIPQKWNFFYDGNCKFSLCYIFMYFPFTIIFFSWTSRSFKEKSFKLGRTV